MKNYNLPIGAPITLVLTLSVLPNRLVEGQGKDPLNLIGSEILIFLMCFAMWITSYSLLTSEKLKNRLTKIITSFFVCILLSNFFYLTTHSFFEDYPLRPLLDGPFSTALIRLSSRGFLIGLVIIPIIYTLETQRQRRLADVERERQKTMESEKRGLLLQELVLQRTNELELTLHDLGESRDALEKQLHLLSRLVASIAHDIHAPLTHTIIISQTIHQQANNGSYLEIPEYSYHLTKSLDKIALYMKNLLEFMKGQVRQESLHMENVNLASVIKEKAALFEEITLANQNRLELSIDSSLYIHSNFNLLSVVIHNLLDNATKYCKNGNVSVNTNVIENLLNLTITNSVAAKSAALQALLSQTETKSIVAPTFINSNRGIGLLLVKDICSLLNIQFTISQFKNTVSARLIFSDYLQQNEPSFSDMRKELYKSTN